MTMHIRSLAAVALPGLAIGLSTLFVSHTFAHVEPVQEFTAGRMTGGGSVLAGPDDLIDGLSLPGSRITHGFELQCNPDVQPNNLQIHAETEDGSKAMFNLESLTWAACWDDPETEANSSGAAFDHYFGRGVGRFNDQADYCAQWLLTDLGEAGVNDALEYLLVWTGEWCPVGDPAAPQRVVLSILQPGHRIESGNHQAVGPRDSRRSAR